VYPVSLHIWHSSVRYTSVASVNEGSYIFSCYSHIQSTGGMPRTCLYFPAAEKCYTSAGTLSHSAEGRRLSWPGNICYLHPVVCRCIVPELSAVASVCGVHRGSALVSTHFTAVADKTSAQDRIQLDRPSAARLPDAWVSSTTASFIHTRSFIFHYFSWGW